MTDGTVQGVRVSGWTMATLRAGHFADGGECFVASDPARPGCTGYAATEDGALDSLARARRAWDRHGGDVLTEPYTTAGPPGYTAECAWLAGQTPPNEGSEG
jgi:hypothetical protein